MQGHKAEAEGGGPKRPEAALASVFETIEQQRAHEYVAEQIRRHIALGVIAPGMVLPPERELVKLFGVGRITIQLALGLLESDNLVETRRGRSGGTFVLAPARDRRALEHRMVEVRQDAERIAESLQYRRIVEPAAAGIAAVALADEDLAVIEAAAARTAQATDHAEFMRHDTAFHLAIARASHNRFFVEAIERIRINLKSALSLLPESDAWHEFSGDEHRAIMEALRSRDPEPAREYMFHHVVQAERGIESLLRSLERAEPGR